MLAPRLPADIVLALSDYLDLDGRRHLGLPPRRLRGVPGVLLNGRARIVHEGQCSYVDLPVSRETQWCSEEEVLAWGYTPEEYRAWYRLTSSRVLFYNPGMAWGEGPFIERLWAST